MFETSRDILNLVLSISIAALAFFICLSLYYVITVFKKGLGLVKKAEDMASKVEMLIDLIKNKVSSSASYIFTLGELVKKVSSFMRDRTRKSDNDDEDEEEYEVRRKTKKKKSAK